MFPSAASPGNPLLTSVRGNGSHGEEAAIRPGTAPQTFSFSLPRRLQGRTRAKLQAPEVQAVLTEKELSPLPAATPRRPLGGPQPEEGGRRVAFWEAWLGPARPAPAAILCALSLPGSLWGRLVLAPACLARSSRRPGSTRRALSPLSPGDRGGEEGGSGWAGPRARAAASCILASVPRAARSRARSQAPVTGWGREARHAGLACSLASCCRGPGLRCH